jgi:large subunit ribosomal protein L6
MSRVGKHPVIIPSGVAVAVDGQRLRVEGKLGTLERILMREVQITREDNRISVRPRDDSVRARMMWGTARTLVANLVEGVSKGFTRKLEITGVGYRVQVQGNTLILQLGYSHDVQYPAPEGIKIQCPDQTHIIVSGASKELVGHVASEIRAFRPVERYKGKGIRYEDEFVLRKEGKKK